MSLMISASFESCYAAARAVNLLRQRGIPASQSSPKTQPSFVPYPYTINPPPAPSAILPGQHALPMFQPPPQAPRRVLLSLAAEPDQVMQARAIIFRCGGIILS